MEHKEFGKPRIQSGELLDSRYSSIGHLPTLDTLGSTKSVAFPLDYVKKAIKRIYPVHSVDPLTDEPIEFFVGGDTARRLDETIEHFRVDIIADHIPPEELMPFLTSRIEATTGEHIEVPTDPISLNAFFDNYERIFYPQIED